MSMNIEVSCLVGSVEVKADKKSGLPVLTMLLMASSGKQIKARVKKIDDRVASLKFGQSVNLRFEEIGYLMDEFGNLTFGSETCSLMPAKS